ncbi:hypothetical protein RKQ66_18075 [Acinetobacter baumannii]|uniref:hypothetical protein n=1 Tax=Acinetobacter baumannii TaxID=470 RepID=UPI00355C81E8
MNLIEQLGGYEAAKEKYQALSDSDMITIGPVEFSAKDYFEDELLEYRRQHNIFEVGDKVVLAKFHSLDTVHEIKRIENLTPHIKGSETTYFLENSLGCWSFQIKHAKDAEIKAGKRLEVKSEN